MPGLKNAYPRLWSVGVQRVDIAHYDEHGLVT
jgi:hypothetical protein